MPTVGLIHAVIPAMEPMRATLATRLPEVRVINLLDEGLLSEVERRGSLDAACVERLATQIGLLESAGADAVMLTCTAYSTVVPQMRKRFAMPIMAVDQVMVERAVATARRIGVLATVPAGLEQQQLLLREAAARTGTQVDIVPSLHPQAMAALKRGDRAEHDRILLEALPALAASVDLVLLAQVSMSPLMDSLPGLPVPVWSSPLLAADNLRDVLESGARR